MNEKLEKSIDAFLDELFAEETEQVVESNDETVEKAMPETIKIAEEKGGDKKRMEVASDAKTTADEGEQAPKSKDEKDGENGRSIDMSNVQHRKANGESTGSYDATITKPAKAPQHETTIAKGESEEENNEVKLSKAEYEEYMSLKKAQESAKEEDLKKAFRVEQEELIKSAISQATNSMKSENEELRKALTETRDLVKAMANKPQARKSISSINAVEKSFNSNGEEVAKSYTKNDLLDAAEELAKSKQIRDEEVIELENSGYIYNQESRKKIETWLKNNR